MLLSKIASCSMCFSLTIQNSTSTSMYVVKVHVCMCFLLGRCFPILMTLHHYERGEQIVGRGGGLERDETGAWVHLKSITALRVWLSAVTVEEEQRAWSFLSCTRGGLSSLNPSSPQALSFWEIKRDTCFFRVRVMIHIILSCTWGWIESWNKTDQLYWVFTSLIQACSLKAFSTLHNNVTKSQREKTFIIEEIVLWFNQDIPL